MSGVFDPEAAFQAFLFDREANGRAPSTLRGLRQAYERFKAFCADTGVPLDFTRWEARTVLDFYRWLRERTKAGETAQATYSRHLHVFLNYCRTRGWIAWEPPKALRERRGERAALNKGQMAAVLRASDATRNGIRNKAIVLTLMATGLRVGELTQLDVDDVDWNSGVLRVRPETSKGRRLRYAPLGPAAKQALFEYVNFTRGATSQRRLFLTEVGEPLAPRGVQMLLKRVGKRAGLKKLHPHMLRHTYATQSLLGGAPLPFVQMVMGHRELSTTAIYLNQTAIQEAVMRQQWTPADGLLSR